MANRSTRNKVRFQATSAYADLRRAENHLVQLAALANENSEYINEVIPVAVTGVAELIKLMEKFNEGL